MTDLRLTVHQTAPLLGDVQRNQEEIGERIQASRDRDLLVFPELATTGYSLRSRVQRLAISSEDLFPFDLPEDSPPVALGFPERGGDELVYNTAVLIQGAEVLLKHRKVYLPTYGLFDESRYFAAGREIPAVAHLPGGWKAGLLICEDLWHPSLLYLLAMQGAEVVLVLSAAPGRGDPTEEEGFGEGPKGSREWGGEKPLQGRSLFSSTANWTLLARTAALQYGLFLAVANRAGVEEGVTFAGESFVVGPDGKLLAAAPQAEPYVLDVALRRQDLRTARNPYSHLRDEDPSFLRRGLDRLLDGE